MENNPSQPANESQQPQINEEALRIAEVENFAFGTPIPENLLNGVQEQQPAEQQPGQVQQQQPAVQPNLLKDNLGFENWEEAKAKWAELNEKASKVVTATPPPKFEYPNDESRLIAENLMAGNLDEVDRFVSGKKLASAFDTQSDEQKLKTYIKLRNPRFDDELINDEYNSLYSVDEENEAFLNKETGTPDALKIRKEKLRVAQRMDNDLNDAKQYIEKYKKDIQLHPINQPVDESYEAHKASSAKAAEDYNNVVVPSLKALKAEDLAMTIAVDDVDNQMQFEMAVSVNDDDFKDAVNEALDLQGFIEKTCYKDGNFQPVELAKLIAKAKHFDKYVQSAGRQAVNAERKRIVSTNSGGANSGKQFSVEENGYLKEVEDFAFGSLGIK